jgi:hypothetical protein
MNDIAGTEVAVGAKYIMGDCVTIKKPSYVMANVAKSEPLTLEKKVR